MAILDGYDMSRIRQRIAKETDVTWLKPQINAALQAIEDKWEADRAGYAAAIEAAAPGVFTLAQKKLLGKHWLQLKSSKGG